MGIPQFITRLREAIAYEISEGERTRALIGQLRSEIEKLKAALADTQYDDSEFEAVLKEIEQINSTPVADGLIKYAEEEPIIVTPSDVAADHGNVAPDRIPSASVADSAITGIESLLMSRTINAGEFTAPEPEIQPSDHLVTQPDLGEDPKNFEATEEVDANHPLIEDTEEVEDDL